MKLLLAALSPFAPFVAFYVGKYAQQFISGWLDNRKIRRRKEQLRLERDRDRTADEQ